MKKSILITVIALCLLLCGCEKTYHGYDDLIEKARLEIPDAQADTIPIFIAGSTDVDGHSLVWFVTGDEYQLHGYYPMDFKQLRKNDSDFQFVKLCKAYSRGQDIAVYPWRGFVALVNNADCTTIQLTYENGSTETVTVGEHLPFLWSTDQEPTEYVFLDKNGNEI